MGLKEVNMENKFVEKLKGYDDLTTDHRTAYNQNKELIGELETAVNTFSFHPEEIMLKASSEKVYDKLKDFCYKWVKVWANKSQPYNTDDRNRISTEIMKDLGPYVPDGKGEGFKDIENNIFTMHRTLIQTASNLVIKVLCEDNKDIKAYIDKRYDGAFRRLPLI